MDSGDAAEPLARRTDGQRLDALVRFLADYILRIVGVHAPKMSGRGDAHLIVADDDLDGRIAGPGDDQAIIACLFQFRAPLMADVGAGEPVVGIRLGAESTNGRAPRIGRARSGQRAGDDHQRVLGRKGVNRLGVLVPGDAGSDTSTAQKIGHVGIDGFHCDGTSGQVYAQKAISPTEPWGKTFHLDNCFFHVTPVIISWPCTATG